MDCVRLYRNEFFKRAYERKRRFVDTFDSCEHTLIRFTNTSTKCVYWFSYAI